MKKLLAQKINQIQVTSAQAQDGAKTEGADIRLAKDLSEISDGISAKIQIPTADAPRTVKVTVTPLEGIFKGGSFPFTLTIDSEYPIKAPKPLYVGPKIFHPNIDDQGGVCLNILKDDWKPVLTISHICFGLEMLFIEPNPDDPLPGTSREAALMMKESNGMQKFAKKAQAWMKGQY